MYKCNHKFKKIYKIKGALRAGGWMYQHTPPNHWAVINLHGGRRSNHGGPWLNINIPNHSTPGHIQPEQWEYLAEKVYRLLKKGVDVAVVCKGAHGRTGTVLAILIALITHRHDPKTWAKVKKDPIAYVRKKHCKYAVENNTQANYVYKIVSQLTKESK